MLSGCERSITARKKRQRLIAERMPRKDRGLLRHRIGKADCCPQLTNMAGEVGMLMFGRLHCIKSPPDVLTEFIQDLGQPLLLFSRQWLGNGSRVVQAW